MATIILLETSTALCSTAIAVDGEIKSYRESSQPKAHASKTAVFVEEMLSETGITFNDCDAVCVSMGPGSYTGLRVGVSTAKGLCFGAKKPLLAVGTLDTLVAQAVAEGIAKDFDYIVPMIDARRMEVYSAVFKATDEGCFKQICDTTPMIVDENSYADIRSNGRVLFIGDGAEKCADTLKGDNEAFVQCCPKASSMLLPAINEFQSGKFRDVAYFEPFYLKEFVATVSKKKLF